jgi:hypothetical protein
MFQPSYMFGLAPGVQLKLKKRCHWRPPWAAPRDPVSKDKTENKKK